MGKEVKTWCIETASVLEGGGLQSPFCLKYEVSCKSSLRQGTLCVSWVMHILVPSISYKELFRVHMPPP